MNVCFCFQGVFFKDNIAGKKITNTTCPTSKSQVRTRYYYRVILFLNFLLFFLPFILGRLMWHILCRRSGLTLFYSWQEYSFCYILQSTIRNKIIRYILVPILVLTLITLLSLQKILHLRHKNNSPVQTTFRVSQHVKTLGTKFN
jgi:hypothetical protein